MKISLETAKDAAFLFRVYVSSREQEISLWGWTKEQQMQFLRMQHEAQQRFYHQKYPDLEYSLIIVDGQKAGRVGIAQLNEEFVLVDIIVLPVLQSKGIGSKILQELQIKAQRKNMYVGLSVLNGNPAERLYKRFGFQVVSNNGVYTMMKWKPV
ncbi:MAG: GNAT family N-acetyltransferase [Pelosinus sp.]|nr:GNAT family N-acetyltransferase [Pelosinus sp.]